MVERCLRLTFCHGGLEALGRGGMTSCHPGSSVGERLTSMYNFSLSSAVLPSLFAMRAGGNPHQYFNTSSLSLSVRGHRALRRSSVSMARFGKMDSVAPSKLREEDSLAFRILSSSW